MKIENKNVENKQSKSVTITLDELDLKHLLQDLSEVKRLRGRTENLFKELNKLMLE